MAKQTPTSGLDLCPHPHISAVIPTSITLAACLQHPSIIPSVTFCLLPSATLTTRSGAHRKNIVPHEYRRHFPTEMKDHNSHDILLLCTSCHAASNVYDGFLKQQLAEEHSAPQGCEEGVRTLEDSERPS